MGSEQNQRNGLDRDSDGCKGFADQFIILGVDIEPEALKARYEGTKRHAYVCAVIDGLVQKQRTKTKRAPAWLVKVLRAATHIPPIKVADLGRDGTLDGWEDEKAKKGKRAGKNWVIVDDGRQRTMARRELDDEATAAGLPRKQLAAVYETYSAKNTYVDAVTSRVGANLREPRSFSSRAEDAADMKRGGYVDEDIAPYAEAKDAAEVAMLLALDTCIQDVKDAVDAGKVALVLSAKWAKLSDEEQASRVARAVVSGKKAKDAAAPPRARTCPSAVVTGISKAFYNTTTKAPQYTGEEVAALLRWVAGDTTSLEKEAKFERVWRIVESGEAEMQQGVSK